MMKLRDRMRRWWSPAQWADDHPTEREQQAQPNKNELGSLRGWVGSGGAPGMDKHGRDFKKQLARDFKKPR